MAKFSINIHGTGKNSYTYQWLKYMCRKYEIEIAEPKNADIHLVSVCDLKDLSIVWNLKRSGKPIIMGGSEAFNDLLYAEIVDLLSVGEGFEFFHDLQNIKDKPSKYILEKLKEKKYIHYSSKKQKTIPSTYIDWSEAPIIRVGEKKKMILTGRGCHNKCHFCFTSWTTKHQINPHIPPISREMMMISNDNATKEELKVKAYVRSMTVKDYLKMTKKEASNCRNYRFGVESFSENTRAKLFKKPIKNELLKKIFDISQFLNHNIRCFIIAGVDSQDSILEFLNIIGSSVSLKPAFEIKGTYFNPCLHTPLQNYDIRKLYKWNKRYLYGLLSSFSPRFRLNIVSDPGDAYWRTCFHRCGDKEQINTVWKWRHKRSDEIMELIEKNNWEHMYNKANPTNIEISY